MDLKGLKKVVPSSPAFILDADVIKASMRKMARLRNASGCKLLYSIKALPLGMLMERLKPDVDGFSVSSLFEARLADTILAGSPGTIHLTTPGVRPEEIDELAGICSHISANSLTQFASFSQKVNKTASLGLRVNPQLSYTADARYDPCRPFSKLGVPLDTLIHHGIFNEVNGMHFHTVFGQTSYASLSGTLAGLKPVLALKPPQLKWLNLGGGYLYGQIAQDDDFVNLVTEVKQNLDVEVFIEPGYALAGQAGALLTTVLDVFDSGGKTVAVLDTSVNHHPEVFEYQKSPALAEHIETGGYPAILAGSTCLAGDLFGEYRFSQPLQIGDRIVFQNVGAYSLVKANRFNGYNLPDIYWHETGGFTLVKSYPFGDYENLWLGEK